MPRYKTMGTTTQKKFKDFSDHMREVLCYLVFEFKYGTRLKQKSDVIPKCVETIFKPNNSHKTDTKWSHSDASITYGIDNHGNEYATLTIKGVASDIPVLPARKMAKLISCYLADFNS